MLSKYIQISKPTKEQIKHDAWLIITAFFTSAFAIWQIQPNKLSKAAVIAAFTAGLAAVITVGKSIFTTL